MPRRKHLPLHIIFFSIRATAVRTHPKSYAHVHISVIPSYGPYIVERSAAYMSLEGRVVIPLSKNFFVHYKVHNSTKFGTIPLVCVHGIAGNCTDFDYLGSQMSGFPIISVDIPGRGNSDWLEDVSLYNYNTYCSTILHLARHLKVKKFNFLGTSMGGIIGMFLASRFPSMVNKLVLNDIGPYIHKKPLKGIVQYLNQHPIFRSIEEVEKYMKSTFFTFGIKQQEHWDHLVKHGVMKTSEGYVLSFDPTIGTALKNEVQQIKHMDIWDTWESISCDTLVIRGEYSNVLTSSTIQKMQATKKNVDCITYEGVGHAPALFEKNKIQPIELWLSS